MSYFASFCRAGEEVDDRWMVHTVLVRTIDNFDAPAVGAIR